MVRAAAVAGLLACGCGASLPARPSDSCEALDAGFSGDASPRPLAVVADRVSDHLELYSVAPTLARAGCLSLDENPNFIDEPFDLALSPAGDFLYVVLGHASGYQKGTLLKLRLPGGTRAGEVVLGEEPSMLALSADGSRAYVSLFRNLAHPSGPWADAGAVVAVDTAAMRVVDQVEVCNAALGIALDEPRGRAWVACVGGDAVALLSLAPKLALSATLPLDDGRGTRGSQPAYVVLDGAHAFVTAQASGDLWVFDQAQAQFTKRIGFQSGDFPQRMARVPNSPSLLVALDYQMQLAVVDTNALAALERIALPGIHPQGIAVTADGRYALVSDENDLVAHGRLVRVDLAGLGAGGAHLDGTQPALVFPQAVLLIP